MELSVKNTDLLQVDGIGAVDLLHKKTSFSQLGVFTPTNQD